MNYRILVTSLLLLISQITIAKISVSTDREPVVMNESFQLMFKSDEKINTQPDFEPLKESFTILSKSRRSNTQIFNGNITYTQQWILVVLPKTAGKLQIPEINFGNESSQPRSIMVEAKLPSLNNNQTDDIFLQVKVSTVKPYVQAQVIYTLKLFRAFQTNSSSLNEPQINGGHAVIKNLDNDKNYETRLNGKRYWIFERSYVIFPQVSGPLTIEPIIFEEAQTGLGSFKYNLPVPQSGLIVRQSEAIHLDVQPIPDSFSGDTWLPASQLSIQEQWSVSPEKLKQGEATTRTLTLTANGLAASNLPIVDSLLPVHLKQYSEQPEFSETMDRKGFVGVRREKMAIIPTEAGDYVLPAIEIPWWNTETDKLELAELPERTIHVDASATMSAPAVPINNVQQQENEVVPSLVEEKESINVTEPLADQTPWKWISLDLFILWLMTLFVFWKTKRKPTLSDNQSAAELSVRHNLKQLKQACGNNDAAATKQALLDWAKVMWPNENINSINSIKIFCDKDLQLKIDELNAFLYGKAESQWNGAAFLKSFESQSFEKKVKTEGKGKLEPLYKT